MYSTFVYFLDKHRTIKIIMAGFHALSARTLAGEVVKMDKYKGKVVLVENTASL